MLTGTAGFLFQQGFPRSVPFAQTRAGFRVAELACDEALATQPTPGGPITCHLFRLTPQLEDAFENERNCWMGEPQDWANCFKVAWALDAEHWLQALIDLADLDPDVIAWARQQAPQTGKALRIDDPFEITRGTSSGWPPGSSAVNPASWWCRTSGPATHLAGANDVAGAAAAAPGCPAVLPGPGADQLVAGAGGGGGGRPADGLRAAVAAAGRHQSASCR